MGVALFGVILSFSLVLLVVSLFTLLFVRADSPEFAPTILSVAANVITVIGCGLVLRKLSARKHQ
jgi:uncharacterized membrane protein YcjF (UPF0283 family)